MKVALDARAAASDITGVGRYIIELAKGLKKQGIEVTLIYDRNPLIEIKHLRKVILVGNGRYRWEQKVLANYLNSSDFDIYHATWNYGIPWSYQGKSVLTVHDIIPIAWPRYFFGRNIINFPRYIISLIISLIKARRVLVDSTSTQRDLSRLLRVPKSKMKLVPLGLEMPGKTSDGNAVKEKYGLMGPYLIYLGGIDKRKNIDGLIKAFAKSESMSNYDLIVVGKHSEIYRPLVNKLGIQDKVKFLGYVSEKDKYLLLKGAIALVYPSFYEGFGFPVLEAMSVGTPIITSNTSSLPEAAGDAGIKVNPRKVADIAKAMDKVTSDSKIRNRLRQAGFDQVKKFSWSNTIEKTIDVYKEIILNG